MTYRYRVTAVGPEGPLARATSPEISTHDGETLNLTILKRLLKLKDSEQIPVWMILGFIKAGRPKRIYTLKEVVHENSLDLLIGWDPPDGKPHFK